MIEINGEYGSARIFADNTDEETLKQLNELVNLPIARDANIRIMPDVHAGYGVPIGTTMKITDKVVPYFIGVDIGCGMLVQKLEEKELDFEKLDKSIHKHVPAGFNVNNKPHRYADIVDITRLKCWNHIDNHNKHRLSVGSLGGGNHFIEVDKDENGDLYLVIHSGSRNLGKQIADYYQNKAHESMKPLFDITKFNAYLTGELMSDYLHDMEIAQRFASNNRYAIADTIGCGMRFNVIDDFETIHNYIEMDTMTLRKGAVRAGLGEKLIVPMNMSYGSLICIGKGNPEWNNSANHGAGRTSSRKQAKKDISLEQYKESMSGIYTTSVCNDTIDEAPMAYKDADSIMNLMKDTVEIISIIKPVYNFKSK
jgi:tRNA-splicing ligase RtcB (3'-phosphate/5'-hydroxy nucleic acid ligase)